MNWMIVVPVALLAGFIGWFVRSKTYDPWYEGLELGPVFAGISSAALAVGLCFFVSVLAAGPSISDSLLVVVSLLVLLVSGLVVAASMMGTLLGTLLGGSLLAMILLSIPTS